MIDLKLSWVKTKRNEPSKSLKSRERKKSNNNNKRETDVKAKIRKESI